MDCPFCEIPRSRVVSENRSAFLIYDGYPVTKLHSLVIPKRHVADIWDFTASETADCLELMRQQKDTIQTQDEAVQGFNVGINVGEASGQTVFHAHIHLIPRRVGDVSDPRGGVRGVIPSKRTY